MSEPGKRAELVLTFSGVAVEKKPSDHFVAADWLTISLAPLWVFQMVASADRRIDDKERAAFEAELAQPPSSELTAFLYAQTRANLASLERTRDKDRRGPLYGLQEVESLLGRYPNPDEARALREALVALASRIAEASGGGLLGLGSKVSREEAHVVEALRKLFAVPSSAP